MLFLMDEDFERRTQMLTGSCLMQIAGAAATYSMAAHLAKGPATAAYPVQYCGLLEYAGLRFSKRILMRLPNGGS
jgi:hypothetical protein